jgi:hypothetical protein
MKYDVYMLKRQKRKLINFQMEKGLKKAEKPQKTSQRFIEIRK